MVALAPRPLIALAVLLAAACGSSATSSPSSTSSPSPRPTTASLGCAWYTATPVPGEIVTVLAIGPACQDRTLVGWLVRDTDMPWTSESVIPGALGTLLAQLARNGTVVRVFFTGPTPSATSGPAPVLAGRIANGLQAAGWTPQRPG